ncbi:MAG: EAL domain-containing protein [Nitrospirota bacterium]|nr:EAL domain-containing protein [Nitrospirota bacterium]
MLLLTAAAGGLVLSHVSFIEHSPLPSLDGLDRPSLLRLWSLAFAFALAIFIVIFALSALFRREVLRRRRSDSAIGRFRQAADASSDLITIMTTSGRIEYVNDAVERSTGYLKDTLVNIWPSPRMPWYNDAGLFRQMRDTVRSGGEFMKDIDGRTREGGPLLIGERVVPFRNDKGVVTRMVSTARDLTRERHLEDRIDYLGRYDPLTGLPNRRTLIGQLEQSVRAAMAAGSSLSVLILDIDRFKHVNDLCGSDAGDDVLKQIAGLIQSSVSPADIVARTGNDEFCVIHVDERNPVLAGAVAQQLRTALSQTISAGGHDIIVTISTGIAVHPGHGDDAWTLLKNADLALASAKAQGRNMIQFFDQEITNRVKEFFILERRLFAALRNSEYLLHYQPYCDLQTRKVAGAEALVRWQNAELGVVSPARFIPSLEETGMVIEVGRWILETACNQISKWERMNRHFPVSVNLSMVQFRHQHLVAMVRDTINNFGFDPRRLTLEVTETVFMQDMDFAIKTLKRLKDVGVTLSVDDFGTGYSSLSYIKKLPVDNLKIDISFVRDVSRDQDSASIITAITTLARSLGLKTIAEGVETEEQRNILHLLRCDMGQGFYFSKAVSAGEFEKLLL